MVTSRWGILGLNSSTTIPVVVLGGVKPFGVRAADDLLANLLGRAMAAPPEDDGVLRPSGPPVDPNHAADDGHYPAGSTGPRSGSFREDRLDSSHLAFARRVPLRPKPGLAAGDGGKP